MIFKKLFKPKYQDPDPQVRINAIQTLSPENPEHKQHLHELAFNDASANVNLAALKRLNNFALWCKTADTAKSEQVRKKARNVIEDVLFERSDIRLDDKQKKQFVLECQSNSMLEKMLGLPWLLADDSGLLFEVLDKLNKPHVETRILLNAEHEAVQQALMARTNDEAILSKLLKKSQFDSVKQAAQAKIFGLQQAKSKPAEIENKARMVLSQLLALKDKSDFQTLSQKREQLEQQFADVAKEFDWLSADIKVNLQERYAEISEKVDKVVAQLEPQWLAQQAKNQFDNDFAKLNADVNRDMTLLSELTLKPQSTLAEETVSQLPSRVTDYRARLEALKNHSENSDKASLLKLSTDLDRLVETLERLPKLQQMGETVQSYLSELAALTLPSRVEQLDEARQTLQQAKQNWQTFKKDFAEFWPDSLENQIQRVVKTWKQAIASITEQVKADEKRCRGKLRATEGLLNDGKFKAAMSLFTKVESWYAQLPEKNQAYLSRLYGDVKSKIEEIKDWQAYVASPRKPLLLQEAQTILEHPLPIEQQAKKIRHLRQEWNSLGQSQTESDKEKNAQFEEIIEKAFEPCREHFAQQEQQRADNLAQKQALISTLNEMHSAESSDEALAQALQKIQKQWRNIGHIDHKMIGPIKDQYRQALQPLQERVDKLYESNAEQKQRLHAKLTALLDAEDVFEAVEQAKHLQKQWQTIGFAGHKKDRQLWQAFRQDNDQLFAKRNLVQVEAQQQKDEQKSLLKTQLEELNSAINQVVDLSQIDDVKSWAVELGHSIRELENKESTGLRRQLDGLNDKLIEKQKTLNDQKQKAVKETLFNYLRDSVNNESRSQQDFENLPAVYKQALQSNKQPDWSRKALVVILDILNETPSNAEDQSLRTELQMQLMTNKLQHGKTLSKEDVLILWLQHGQLAEEDSKSLTKLQRHFFDV